MAEVERLTLHHRSADYISFLCDHWAHCGIFETGVLLMYTLEDVSNVANFILLMTSLIKTETPIFYSVLCSLFPKAIILCLLENE